MNQRRIFGNVIYIMFLHLVKLFFSLFLADQETSKRLDAKITKKNVTRFWFKFMLLNLQETCADDYSVRTETCFLVRLEYQSPS